jgi:glycosyltransferase involved in cell wall biosynthesis
MIRLAYLVSRYPSISHTFILREVQALRRAGFDIAIASINPPDRPFDALDADEQEEARGTFVIKHAGLAKCLTEHVTTLVSRPLDYFRGLAFALRLGGLDLRRGLFGLFYFVEAVLLGRWMRARGLGHLHVHFGTPAATVALIASRMFPMRYSMTIHGPDEFYDVPGYYLAQKIEAAKFVLCIGSFARSQVMKLSNPEHWDKLVVSPLGVDPASFAPRPEPPRGGTFEVLCVGRLVPAKGQLVLVAAIEALVRAGRDVRLRLVGDGPDRAAIERAILERGLEGRIVLEGAVNQRAIKALYQGAHAFALASFAEGIPVVLMEAMSMEIPTISTFIAGIPELIRGDVDGLIVPPANVEELAAAIARLIDDPALARKLAVAGRKRVIDRYELSKNITRLADILRERVAGELASTRAAGANSVSADAPLPARPAPSDTPQGRECVRQP